MSKFCIQFDTMLLWKMCSSIGVWMSANICLYTYYMPFINDQVFPSPTKALWIKMTRAKSVATSNMCQSSSFSSNYMCTPVTCYCLTLKGRTIFYIITPYIRMLYSDWLIDVIFYANSGLALWICRIFNSCRCICIRFNYFFMVFAKSYLPFFPFTEMLVTKFVKRYQLCVLCNNRICRFYPSPRRS
jgi:hypothetical protein